MLPDLSKLRSLDALPELPDEIIQSILQRTNTCIRESMFELSWTKERDVLQVVLRMPRLSPKNEDDMVVMKTYLMETLAVAIPEAMPFTKDHVMHNPCTGLLRLAVKPFVVTVPPPHPCHNWVSLSRSLTV